VKALGKGQRGNLRLQVRQARAAALPTAFARFSFFNEIFKGLGYPVTFASAMMGHHHQERMVARGKFSFT
jgi:hypothetical protein